MNRNFTILPGRAVNQEEVTRSLREKGYYSSGIPRPSERKAKKKDATFRPLRARELRYLSPEDLETYINHASACERSKS